MALGIHVVIQRHLVELLLLRIFKIGRRNVAVLHSQGLTVAITNEVQGKDGPSLRRAHIAGQSRRKPEKITLLLCLISLLVF